MLAVAFRKNYAGSSLTNGIFLYVAQAVERVLAVAFGKIYVGSSPIIGILPYVAQAVERVPAVSFGTHNTHKRKTSMPPMGLKHTISAGEGP